MSTPQLSKYFASKQPSSLRRAQMEFSKRTDGVKAINVSIGNVSLPMHPAMQERMFHIANSDTALAQGIVQYSQTVGLPETQEAFLHIIASSGCDTNGLYAQVTDGGSQAMELLLLGVSDANDKPIMLIDPAYSNYLSFAARTSRNIVTLARTLNDEGSFLLPSKDIIENFIQEHTPSAIVVIPYDNPTGQLYNQDDMKMIAELCVKYNMRMISDEAYRELHYGEGKLVSIRKLNDTEVPGIQGRRISIETASKVWNACGLRIGAMVTDNAQFHQQSVAENTTSLCSNTIGQYIFGALAHESFDDLHKRYDQQRNYYGNMLQDLSDGLKSLLPGIIVSRPDASLYSIIDVRNIAKPGFDAKAFSLFCAQEGSVDLNGETYTLLVSPMDGFYRAVEGQTNPGLTQMRVSFVATPDKMKMVPKLFAELFHLYEVTK
ncbi:MAG: aminotransferase class I/II-fold pyridoxal phosphate-dependent enzyme [candidate division SR1 bacterium]|nr:aminotransferase class I/II-fold pyridoxal phosphate-dependent enzyme [candidate division SR1 bacterium]